MESQIYFARTGAPGLRVIEAVLPNWDVWLDGAGHPPPPPHPRLAGWRRCSPGTGVLVKTCTESGKRRPRVAITAMRAWIRRSTRWNTVRRGRGRGNRMGLSPLAILEALLMSERGRTAVTSFCEQVMLRKEATERVRVRNSHPERIGRRGRGRGRGRASRRRARAAAIPDGGPT